MVSGVRAFLSAVLLAISGAAFADELVGQASVINGDTIEIHGARVRIFGIDAPESDQLCHDAQLPIPLRAESMPPRL